MGMLAYNGLSTYSRNNCNNNLPTFVLVIAISSDNVLTLIVFFSLFTDEEIQMIRNMTYYDVLLAVTRAEDTDIQKNVFFWKDGKILKTK